MTEQTKIRSNKITEIETYLHEEINRRKSCSKKLSKYVAAFDYRDKVLVALSAKSCGVSIISFTNGDGAPVGNASASFTLICSLTIGLVKILLSITRKKSMIKFLFCLKVNSVALKL